MSLKRRGRNGIWWVDLTIGGRRVQRSTRTTDRRAAQQFHDQLAGRMWRRTHVGEQPRRTWNDAVQRWARETCGKRTQDRDLGRLRILERYLGNPRLDAIDRDRVDGVADALLRDRGITQPAVNRYLALIRSILRRAEREWGWLERAPVVRLFPEHEGRVRWLSQGEYVRLMRALPDWLRAPAEFTLQTGLRQSNVFGLRWDQVSMDNRVAWVDAGQSKSRKALRVPLNDKALAVLSAQRGRHPVLVFTRAGEPVRLESRAWQRVLRDAGIEDLRWHDLRHTWASWRVMSGTSLHDLLELAGWSDYKMALRYAHLAPAHMDEVATDVRPPRDESASPTGVSPADRRSRGR